MLASLHYAYKPAEFHTVFPIWRNHTYYLIASRIPPGPGGSIARKKDNVQFLGPLEGPLDASGVPLGGLREASGVWEASVGRLGGSWGHLGRQGAQEALKNSQGRSQISPKTTPRGPRWPPKASQRRPQRPPRGPKRPPKHHQNNITSQNTKNLKIDDPLNKNQ